MCRSIAGSQCSRSVPNYPQRSDCHIAHTFRNMYRKTFGSQLWARSDALDDSDGIFFERAPHDRTAQGTKYRLRVVDIHGKSTGGFPPDGFID